MESVNWCCTVRLHWLITAGRTFGSHRRREAPTNSVAGSRLLPKTVKPWARVEGVCVALYMTSCCAPNGGFSGSLAFVPVPSRKLDDVKPARTTVFLPHG